MNPYSAMLEVVILSKIIEKRKNNLTKLNQINNNDFHKLLKGHMERPNFTSDVKNNKNIDIFTTQVSELFKDNIDNGHFESALDFVLKHEGEKLVKRDGIKNESSKYGILQSTAEAFGFKGQIGDLTKEQAKIIYKKLWDKSKAASLPYPLSIVFFDTYVNSPAMAKKLLEKSQGDMFKFLNMREQRYMRLSQKRPDIYSSYLKGWKNRIKDLRAILANYQKSFEARKV